MEMLLVHQIVRLVPLSGQRLFLCVDCFFEVVVGYFTELKHRGRGCSISHPLRLDSLCLRNSSIQDIFVVVIAGLLLAKLKSSKCTDVLILSPRLQVMGQKSFEHVLLDLENRAVEFLKLIV